MFFLNIFQIGKKTSKFDLGILHQMQFLLNAGMKYVLRDIFSRNRLENSFGKRTAIGLRKDNPNLCAIGYIDNIIKPQFTTLPIGGNAQSEYNASKIDTSPVLKRKRTNKIQLRI